MEVSLTKQLFFWVFKIEYFLCFYLEFSLLKFLLFWNNVSYLLSVRINWVFMKVGQSNHLSILRLLSWKAV